MLAKVAHGSTTLGGYGGKVLGIEAGDGGGAVGGVKNLLDGIGRAAFQNKVLEFRNKRCIFVVDFVFATGSCPIASVPNCGI